MVGCFSVTMHAWFVAVLRPVQGSMAEDVSENGRRAGGGAPVEECWSCE